MHLIYGLGNPGEQYRLNRHNAGFLFLDYLNDKMNLAAFKKKKSYCYTLNNLSNHQTALIKPLTYMNASGFAVTSSIAFFKAIIGNIIVIYDDISLPIGKIRIREKGSDGGHNGLKSIQKELGTDNYKKIRVGIGEPKYKGDLINHVLGDFSAEDLDILNKKIFPAIEDALFLFINNNFNEAANRYNGIDLSKS